MRCSGIRQSCFYYPTQEEVNNIDIFKKPYINERNQIHKILPTKNNLGKKWLLWWIPKTFKGFPFEIYEDFFNTVIRQTTQKMGKRF